ncbi:MAG: hypothetical protein NZ853_00040 [Leptospiraceae bacterium]|nr:hypothetical protein [Leptospiraceae bacterium]MDW7976382.1 hypothetical protein [Leptospiraceae bacterium]
MFFRRYIYFIVAFLVLLNLSCKHKEVSSKNYVKPPTPPETISVGIPVPEKPKTIEIDETQTFLANLLAGKIHPLEDLNPHRTVVNSKSYAIHFEEMKKAWKNAENKRFYKMKEWVKKELHFLCKKEEVIFYPFSGPDFLNARFMFPCGKEYILFGLEPVGKIPNLEQLSEEHRKSYFYHIRDSLRSVLNYSFFRTNDMKIDFFKELNGVIPVLFVFLAYHENEIVKVSYIEMSRTNIYEISNFPSSKGISGIRIDFVPKNNKKDLSSIHTLMYFQINISDSNMKNHSYFFDHIKKKGPFITFIKSASYLMHSDHFSLIRKFILDNSHYVIQDDSGIPIRFFMNPQWQLTFYGNYVSPIKLFQKRYQPELRKIYETSKDIKPLPFGTGYHFYPGTSNLLLAIKKK